MKKYMLAILFTSICISTVSYACPVDDDDETEEVCTNIYCCSENSHIVYHPEYPEDE